MLSAKAKYALKALQVLGREYGNGPILISELARREQIPQKFLEAILLQLRNNGLLQSKKGKGGGYSLVKPPALISLGHALRIVEGPLAPLPCVSRTAYRKCEECVDERTCGIRIVMKDVREATAQILDSTSLADIIRRVDLTTQGKDAFNFAI